MKFITFEGCDFSGKSTQIKLLKQYFEINKKKVFLTREPGGTKFAEKVRSLLLSDKEILDPIIEYLLLSAARRDHVNHLIKKKMGQGCYVLSDRFYDSSLCYQGCYKNLDNAVLEVIRYITIDIFQPDLTFLIDISENEILKRASKKREGGNFYDIKSQKFYRIIRQGYLAIANNNPKRVVIIDGNQNILNVARQINKVINRKVFYSSNE